MRAKPDRIVVVGGGVAAERCAAELRSLGFAGSLTLVSAEPELPYDRTLLSKDALAGGGPVDAPLRDAGELARLGIDVRLGTHAVRLDARGARVELSDGDALAYDRLVICTGGRPVRPPELFGRGVHVLREAGDARALRARLGDCERVAVVGGGFLGGEVAAAAAARGLDVTLIEAAPEPLAPILGEAAGRRLRALHAANGVRVLTGAPAARAGDGEVLLRDGRSVAADVVVVAVGMRPNVEWLHGSGLDLDGGIVTDAGCRTTAPGVLAAGDCARWWDVRYGALLRVEHWDTAARHGKAAAAAALGGTEPFTPALFFWSTQHGVRLQAVGRVDGWDEVEVEDGPEPGTFAARYRRRGRLLAVVAAGQPRVVAEARRALAEAA